MKKKTILFNAAIYAALGLGSLLANTYDVTDPSVPLVVDTEITGGDLVKTGPGELNIGGFLPNTYTGKTKIVAGTLNVANPQGLPPTTNVVFGDPSVPAGPVIPDDPATPKLRLDADIAVGNLSGAGQVDLNGHILTISGSADPFGPPADPFTGIFTGAGSVSFQLPGGEFVCPTPANLPFGPSLIKVSFGTTLKMEGDWAQSATSVEVEAGGDVLSLTGDLVLASLVGSGEVQLNGHKLTLIGLPVGVPPAGASSLDFNGGVIAAVPGELGTFELGEAYQGEFFVGQFAEMPKNVLVNGGILEVSGFHAGTIVTVGENGTLRIGSGFGLTELMVLKGTGDVDMQLINGQPDGGLALIGGDPTETSDFSGQFINANLSRFILGSAVSTPDLSYDLPEVAGGGFETGLPQTLEVKSGNLKGGGNLLDVRLVVDDVFAKFTLTNDTTISSLTGVGEVDLNGFNLTVGSGQWDPFPAGASFTGQVINSQPALGTLVIGDAGPDGFTWHHANMPPKVTLGPLSIFKAQGVHAQTDVVSDANDAILSLTGDLTLRSLSPSAVNPWTVPTVELNGHVLTILEGDPLGPQSLPSFLDDGGFVLGETYAGEMVVPYTGLPLNLTSLTVNGGTLKFDLPDASTTSLTLGPLGTLALNGDVTLLKVVDLGGAFQPEVFILTVLEGDLPGMSLDDGSSPGGGGSGGGGSGASPLKVENVLATQQPGTKLVTITYDLVFDQNEPVEIEVWYSSNAGAVYDVPCVSLTGDFGSGVMPGAGKTIVWNAGADWNENFSTSGKIKVIATHGDGQE